MGDKQAITDYKHHPEPQGRGSSGWPVLIILLVIVVYVTARVLS